MHSFVSFPLLATEYSIVLPIELNFYRKENKMLHP